jgi:hypothetical protein
MPIYEPPRMTSLYALTLDVLKGNYTLKLSNLRRLTAREGHLANSGQEPWPDKPVSRGEGAQIVRSRTEGIPMKSILTRSGVMMAVAMIAVPMIVSGCDEKKTTQKETTTTKSAPDAGPATESTTTTTTTEKKD